MRYTKLAFLPTIFFAFNTIAQEHVNGLSYPVNRNGELQSAMNGGYWNANPDFPASPRNYNSSGAYTNSLGTWNNLNFPSGTATRNARPIEQYKFIASTQHEGNYWSLILKDSNNIIRMKGSYSDQELTTPEGMFYYYHSNGNMSMSGLYNQGLRNGIWISHYANGKLKDSISYWNGKKNGSFQRFHLTGTLYISGNYADDVMQGEWREFYQNGKPASITEYAQGSITKVIYYTRAGEKIEQEQNKLSPKLFFNRRYEIEKELIHAAYYGSPTKLPNGKFETVLYNMEGQKIIYAQWSDQSISKKSGLFERYDNTGLLRLSCFYDNNQLTGPFKTWYETGIPANSVTMKKNMRDGVWESFYETGFKKDSGTFENDIATGLWSYWDENGDTRSIGAIKNNHKTGDWKTYDRNGKILYIQRYRKSKYDEAEMIRINEK
jgi:antitoxin component YwqK of YwqJK toxin-antitoxin module